MNTENLWGSASRCRIVRLPTTYLGSQGNGRLLALSSQAERSGRLASFSRMIVLQIDKECLILRACLYLFSLLSPSYLMRSDWTRKLRNQGPVWEGRILQPYRISNFHKHQLASDGLPVPLNLGQGQTSRRLRKVEGSRGTISVMTTTRVSNLANKLPSSAPPQR